MKKLIGVFITTSMATVAIILAYHLWQHYMNSPWTRDGRVRANIINVAADVSGIVTHVLV
ncbi:MAG TPA: efflux transporter periplasmic adaptor subunit, partial [Methylophaga aminisulfidivorans]|nr:efflux transporter periplasmic adaptor subunit [Methylophaga aminisulfidivorans]